MRRGVSIALVLALAAAVSCGTRTSGQKARNPFPVVDIPSMYTAPEDRAKYAVEHFWDHFEGVPMEEIEKGLPMYLELLEQVPMSVAQKSTGRLFTRIEEAERADTSAHYYTLMTQMVSKYLFDPNSPYRNEDFYLPFVSAMAASLLTPEDMRHAYEVEAATCSKNRFGEAAPDFTVKTIRGTAFRLYDIKAEYTMLFFSNPGCTACKSIIDDVCGRPYVNDFIQKGILAVVNVYIDEDLKAWREYEHNYPENWHTGYDPNYTIRKDVLYDVRAIPSLYLLDSGKKILMKDAPTEKVMSFLDRLSYNR